MKEIFFLSQLFLFHAYEQASGIGRGSGYFRYTPW